MNALVNLEREKTRLDALSEGRDFSRDGKPRNIFGCFNRLQPDTLCPREAERQIGESGGEGRLKVTYLIWPGPNQINLKPLWHIEHMAVVGEEIFFRYTPAVALIQQHVLPMRAAVR